MDGRAWQTRLWVQHTAVRKAWGMVVSVTVVIGRAVSGVFMALMSVLVGTISCGCTSSRARKATAAVVIARRRETMGTIVRVLRDTCSLTAGRERIVDSAARGVMLAVRARVIWAPGTTCSDGVIYTPAGSLIVEARVLVTPAGICLVLATVGVIRQVVGLSMPMMGLGWQVAPVCTFMLGGAVLCGGMFAKANSRILWMMAMGWLRGALLGRVIMISVSMEFVACGSRRAQQIATTTCGTRVVYACVKMSEL